MDIGQPLMLNVESEFWGQRTRAGHDLNLLAV